MATALTTTDFIGTQYKDYEVFTKSEGNNIRQLPGTSGKVVSKMSLNKSAGIVMSQYKVKKDNYTWYYIKLAKPVGEVKYGFVAMEVVTFKKGSTPVTTTTTTTTPTATEVLSKCQKELNNLLIDQKNVYVKLNTAYLILLNIKNGKVKANPNFDYQTQIQSLLRLRTKYLDLNNEIINKQEVVKVIDATGSVVKDTSKSVLISYGENVMPYRSFLHGIGLIDKLIIGVIIGAILAVGGYVLYGWLTDAREKSKATGQSVDAIIQVLKDNGVSQSVIDTVKPVIAAQVSDAFDAGKDQGENSGLFGKYKTPLIIIGVATLTFMVLPYIEKGKDRIQNLRK